VKHFLRGAQYWAFFERFGQFSKTNLVTLASRAGGSRNFGDECERKVNMTENKKLPSVWRKTWGQCYDLYIKLFARIFSKINVMKKYV
jgi:hypothetical protein